MIEPGNNMRLQAALGYAERGIPILPCHSVVDGACSCRNPHCSSPGRHPRVRHGLYDATVDAGLIKKWWRRWPEANVAGRMGKNSGYVIIDVDPRNGGDQSFNHLQEELGELPEQAPLAESGRGGRHVFFSYPEDGLAKMQDLQPGIDVLAEGSYVILPPSRTEGEYKFLLPLNGAAPPLPAPWLKYIRSAQNKARSQKKSKGNAKTDDDRIPQGRRNQWLTSEAGKLRRPGFGPDVMFAALMVLNQRCDPPLGEDEIRKIAQSVSRYEPRTNQILIPDSRFDDISNAARFVALHGKTIRYVDRWGCWFVWEGSRWTRDTKNVRVCELAKDVSRNLYQDLATNGHEERKAAWARQSAQRKLIEAAVALSRGLAGVLISHDQLDSDPYALGVVNGWIDLKTGVFHEPEPAKLMTLQSSVEWDAAAKCPRWLQAMIEWFPNDETRDYVQRLTGQAIVGTLQDHIFVILFGEGANGKGTFIRALRYVLGPYAVSVALSLLVETQYAAHDSATSVLFRKRLAVASETSRRIRLDEASVKNLTGGDKIPARRVYENPWEFEPTHTLWLQTNYLPEVSGRDRGIWRRVRVVPWTAHFKRNQEENLDDILRSEASGILRWCVEGVQRYLIHGLDEPDEVLKATAAYRNHEDIISRWMRDCGFCLDPRKVIKANELCSSWKDWSATLFGSPRAWAETANALVAEGCAKHRKDCGGVRNVLFWRGIGRID